MKITTKDYLVETTDERKKKATLTIRNERGGGFHDENSYVPPISLYYLDAINGEKWTGEETSADITMTQIRLTNSTVIQYLNRLDVYQVRAREIEKEFNELCITNGADYDPANIGEGGE